MSIAESILSVNTPPDGEADGPAPGADLSALCYTNPAGIRFRVVYAETDRGIAAFLLDAFGQLHGIPQIQDQIRRFQELKDRADLRAARDAYADAIRWRAAAVRFLLATEAEIERRLDNPPPPDDPATPLVTADAAFAGQAAATYYDQTRRRAAATAQAAAATGVPVIIADQALARSLADQEAQDGA